jgi:hypothetical protein
VFEGAAPVQVTLTVKITNSVDTGDVGDN